MFIVRNIDEFNALFINRLDKLLDSMSLGAYILVLSNSLQNEQLKNKFNQKLKSHFKFFTEHSYEYPPDDRVVLGQLRYLGLDELDTWQHETAGDWQLVRNTMRKLRPARNSTETLTSLQKPFCEQGFHFDKPYLKDEVLWQGDHLGSELRVLYNKFPFAPWHLLMVPDPSQHKPQYLDFAIHQYMMDLQQKQQVKLYGFGLGYNSLAAFASVNHLHFQCFLDPVDLPIESSKWKHNGGEVDYPLDVTRFSTAQDSWHLIDEYQNTHQPFNILYHHESCYVVAQKGQTGVMLSPWAQGAAWYEVSGVWTIGGDWDDIHLDEQTIYDEMSKLRVGS